MKKMFSRRVIILTTLLFAYCLLLEILYEPITTHAFAARGNDETNLTDETVMEQNSTGLQPVYRLYCQINGEHLYTTDLNECKVLYSKYGWGYEGIGWYSSENGKPVYRLYHPGLKNHLYTLDLNEVRVLCTSYGWIKDNNGKSLFYSNGSVPIYRVYNPSINGMHHLMTDQNEYRTLPKYGWKQEGKKINAAKIGEPVRTQYYPKMLPLDPGKQDVPNDAVEFNGHQYYLYNVDGIHSYNEALQYCINKGGYLATITSQNENDFLFSYITGLGCENAYFGLSDASTEGKWEWCTGEKLLYTNWHSGEPNGENPNEDYAMFYFKFSDGTWNDGDFSGKTVNGGTAFICEWGDYSL